MPIEVIAGRTILRSRNKTSKYPNPKRDPERYLPYPTISHQPKFAIAPTDKIFTIGSCFARNTERALVSMKLPVLSAMVEGVAPEENITNKYATKSILHDLQVAFSSAGDGTTTIYESPKGGYINLTFGGSGAYNPQTLEQTQDLTRRYFNNLKKISEANIVILTLGLVEVWFDKNTKTYLNIMPPTQTLKAEPNRFEVHISSYDDIVSDVNQILAIIRANAQPDVKFLITVSPVPLHATFRDEDCMQANSYSKSVQRAAADAIRLQHKDVAYFPSYEMVTMASPQIAWIKDDYRHVRPEMVERIMREVLSKYLPSGLVAPSKDELQNLLRQKNYAAAAESIEHHLLVSKQDLRETPVYVQFYYSRACAGLGRRELALQSVNTTLATSPKHKHARRLKTKIEWLWMFRNYGLLA